MSTRLRLLPVRVSTDLRAMIDQVGPVNPATRALLLLGADAAGLELSGLEREIAGLLAAPLDAAVHNRLRQIFTRIPTTRAHPEAPPAAQSPCPAMSEPSSDPFTNVGIEV